MRGRAFPVLLVVISILVARFVRADGGGLRDLRERLPRESRGLPAGDPRTRAEEVFQAAEKADEAFDFARALALYDETRAIDPGSPRSPRAEARAAMLRTHAEGGYAPLVELERVRRDPALASDVRVIDELVAHAEAFPAGPVQVEAWTVGAEGYAHRFGRPADAARLYRRVMTAERADPIVAQKAARDLAALQIASGDLAGAEETVRSAGPRADGKLLRDVARAVWRRRVHLASIATLVFVIAVAVTAILRASRRSEDARRSITGALRTSSRMTLVVAAYVAISGAFLASRYETGTSAPFLALGAALVPLLLLARAWGAAASAGPAARAGRALGCAASVLAAAFLVLESIDASFLDGMGL